MVFVFYKALSPTPWNFEKILRNPLHSWGFHSNCLLPMFLLEAPNLLANLIAISAQAGLEVLYQSFRSYCLLSMVIPDPSNVLSLRRSCGIIVHFVTCEKGIHISQRDCFEIERNVLGSLLSAFYYCHPFTKKISMGCPPFSLT